MPIMKKKIKMDNNQKEINDNELEKANGGIKIVIDRENNKFLDTLKNLVEKLKNKLRKK